MGIGSYKEAERYRMRTNKNLTRTFYLDTRRTLDEEPFAWEQPQDAGIMQPETVQEFADGGRVGFAEGSEAKILKLYNQGTKSSEIADQLKLRRPYVSNKITKLINEGKIKERLVLTLLAIPLFLSLQLLHKAMQQLFQFVLLLVFLIQKQ